MTEISSELNVALVSIDEIRADTAAQPREVMSTDKVEEYSDLMKSGVLFPRPVVFFDGSIHWLADGFHRLQAARSADFVKLYCVVKEGTLRDAVLYSCGANAAHGIQRTNEDKRRAVMKILQDDEWKTWSARDIAKQCQVSHTLVNELREQMTPADTGNVSSMDMPSSEPKERTFIHPKTGKPTQMKTGGIGKRNRAAKPEKDTPARPQATLTPTESAESAATVSQADTLIVPAAETEGFKRESLVSGVRTFGAFCSANPAIFVAASIPLNEVEEIRASAARIYEWLDRFTVAIDRVEGAKAANRCQESPLGSGNAPCSVKQTTGSTSTSPEFPDLPAFLDRRAEARADASKPNKEVPAP
jgi:hypothetical protein